MPPIDSGKARTSQGGGHGWVPLDRPNLGFVCVLAALLALLVLPSSDARADDTALGGTGGGVRPIEVTGVRLAAETVEAVVYGHLAEYRVTFRFENEGPKRRLRLGFPFAAFENREEGLPYTSIRGFRAWREGEPLEVTPQLLHPESRDYHDTAGYFLHEAVFPQGETTITVSYLAPPKISAGGRLYADDLPPELRGWMASYEYWLHTGAGWAGTIGKAVVQYRFADTFLGGGVDVKPGEYGLSAERPQTSSVTHPAGYTMPDESTIRWEFEDFEPVVDTYPLTVIPGDRLGVRRMADALRTMEEVVGVEITGKKVIAEIESYKSAHVVHDRLYDESAGSQLGFEDLWEKDPYPYNVTVAFSDHQYFHMPEDEPFGPRITSSRRADAAPDDDRRAGLTSIPLNTPIIFTLEKTPQIREVRVASGDLSRLDGFGRTARPRTVRLTFSDGSTKQLELEDHPGMQRFPVDARGDRVELEVLDVYPGSVSSDAAAIWEIEFGTEPAPEFEGFSDLLAGMTGGSAGADVENPADDSTATTGGSSAESGTASAVTSGVISTTSSTSAAASDSGEPAQPGGTQSEAASSRGVPVGWIGLAAALIAAALGAGGWWYRQKR